LDLTGGAANFLTSLQDAVGEALMVSLVQVVVVDELAHSLAQRAFAKEDHTLEALLA
jgi:hypothetical protein